jgi:hypothetical protein
MKYRRKFESRRFDPPQIPRMNRSVRPSVSSPMQSLKSPPSPAVLLPYKPSNPVVFFSPVVPSPTLGPSRLPNEAKQNDLTDSRPQKMRKVSDPLRSGTAAHARKEDGLDEIKSDGNRSRTGKNAVKLQEEGNPRRSRPGIEDYSRYKGKGRYAPNNRRYHPSRKPACSPA